MLLNPPLPDAHPVHSTAALVPYHFTRRQRQVVPVEHLINGTVEDFPHLHYPLSGRVYTCRRYRLRFRVVFPWNVPLPATSAYPSHSWCRPLLIHDHEPTHMAALTPHGCIGLPTPYSPDFSRKRLPRSLTRSPHNPVRFLSMPNHVRSLPPQHSVLSAV